MPVPDDGCGAPEIPVPVPVGPAVALELLQGKGGWLVLDTVELDGPVPPKPVPCTPVPVGPAG